MRLKSNHLSGLQKEHKHEMTQLLRKQRTYLALQLPLMELIITQYSLCPVKQRYKIILRFPKKMRRQSMVTIDLEAHLGESQLE
jgi:hypothetical protein